MNYLEIVLQGYFNENNKEFLEKYFFRELKKAEKEQFFEAAEFFNGCTKVVEGWEKYLQDEVFKRKKELYLMLDGAKNGTIKYEDLQGKAIEQKRQETIEYCKKELKDVRPNGIGSLSFTVPLHSLSNGLIANSLTYNEVLEIKHSILKAFEKARPQNEALPPHQEVIRFEFKNNFDNVAYKAVYYHFKTGLLKTKMLTEVELQRFLISAFQDKTPPKNKFNLKNIESKDKVMKVFYQYYKDIAGKPHGKQKEYAGLLGNYFQGYKTNTVSSNFSKSVY